MLKYHSTCEPDPNLANFTPDFGQYETILGAQLCRSIAEVIASREGINRLIGSIMAAPTKTPVPALELLLREHIGDVAFEDNAKKLTGRLVRQAVEHLGGSWVRSGAKAPVQSTYNRGSIYSFST